ncbi:hypothetical protein GCM10028792_20440 [Salinisphaera aquimarina]
MTGDTVSLAANKSVGGNVSLEEEGWGGIGPFESLRSRNRWAAFSTRLIAIDPK